MRLVYPGFDYLIDTDISQVNTMVIENQNLLYSFTFDMFNQVKGNDGDTILSSKNERIDISKYLEIVTDYYNVDLNKRTLITKVLQTIEDNANLEENYMESRELITQIERLIEKWSFSLPCSIDVNKANLNSLIKSLGISITDDYEGQGQLVEKLIDYFELVREFDKDKLFVTINLRSYVDNNMIQSFMRTVLDHQFHVLMIDNKEYQLLSMEKRIIIDKDLCMF